MPSDHWLHNNAHNHIIVLLTVSEKKQRFDFFLKMRAIKIVRQIKASAATPGDLRSIPGTELVKGENSYRLSSDFHMSTPEHVQPHVHKQVCTHTNK